MSNEKKNDALSSAVVEAKAAKQNLPQGRIVWARPDPTLQANISEFPARDVPESSRVPVSFIKEARTESHLAALYGSSALLRLFKTSQSAPRTDNVQTIYREACHFPQMCPNAMPSRRKEADPESRDYLIVRFIQGSLDAQAKRIHYLRQLQQLHLSLVVFDAKSVLEAWFLARDKSKQELQDFFHIAAKLGSDTSTWSLRSLARTPDAYKLSHDPRAFAVLKKAGFAELCGLQGLHYPRRQHVLYLSPQ